MLAFSIENPGDTHGKVVTLPKPTLEGPGFALVRVLRAGVCNTDLEILQGYMGFTGVLGHEFVGIVEQVYDDNDAEWIGKRVCGDINVGCAACGVCDQQYDSRCSQMSRNHCPNRSVLGILRRNGTMAEYLTLPVKNLHPVPDDMSDEVAVFSEPLAAACRIVEQGLVSYDDPPDKVAILGDGKLGLMIAEVLGREHAERVGASHDAPTLFGKHPNKLQLVSEAGVTTKLIQECQDSTAFNGVSSVYAGTFDVVVDATGSPDALALSAALCRPMGTLVLKSTCASTPEKPFNSAPFVIDEIRVVGSRCGPIDKALALLAIPDSDPRSLNVAKYITQTFPLSQADEAIRCAAEKSTMKVQIICNEK